jgi:hypothetical protein
MKNSRKRVEAIPQKKLEELGILPLRPAGRSDGEVIQILCSWPDGDEHRRQKVLSALRKYAPGAEFELVHILGPNASAEFDAIWRAQYGQSATKAVGHVCVECDTEGKRVVHGRDGDICLDCLRRLAPSGASVCSMCEKNFSRTRAGESVTVCEACYESLVEILQEMREVEPDNTSDD